ncbi:hypothetical protein BU16DRAFT_38220 [Lophium mytilinum]|uniref:Uncharacterized protein n=1 Tax=Lophium mytilinum TaxID=390894 RepID=A0A6A6RFL0_9PEZI|nr:hypothetical protein BU16DRAFT_38220 [Lophium mytilinum]
MAYSRMGVWWFNSRLGFRRWTGDFNNVRHWDYGVWGSRAIEIFNDDETLPKVVTEIVPIHLRRQSLSHDIDAHQRLPPTTTIIMLLLHSTEHRATRKPPCAFFQSDFDPRFLSSPPSTCLSADLTPDPSHLYRERFQPHHHGNFAGGLSKMDELEPHLWPSHLSSTRDYIPSHS